MVANTPIFKGPGNCTQAPNLTTLWTIDTLAYRVCASQSPNDIVYELFSDGSGRGGAPQVRCGSEFDAFLSPTETDYSGVPVNFAPRQSASNPSLADISALNIRFNMQVGSSKFFRFLVIYHPT